jgi:signal transduction histidine kinase/ABC-type branched-subunit amino acid transport system ATPase component
MAPLSVRDHVSAHAPRPVSSAPALRVSRLGVSYGTIEALTDVNLEVARGEVVAVSGEPGAGKSTLVRCLVGDITPDMGLATLDRMPLAPASRTRARNDVAVVWQEAELCLNLDVAGNLLLGRETPRLMRSSSRFHAAAAEILREFRIPIRDTTRLAGSLSGGDRRLLAMARAISRRPSLLILDEPTAELGAVETAQAEELILRVRDAGTAVLLISRDIPQMFRIANRIVVLRRGRVVAQLDPSSSHPDDVAGLQAGQEIDTSPRRQLTRLHGLADRLISADPSSTMSLILSALGAALGSDALCIHVLSDGGLVCEASLGFTPELMDDLQHLPVGALGGPPGQAAVTGERVVVERAGAGQAWARSPAVVHSCVIAASWSVPVAGPSGVIGVITVFPARAGGPDRDELDLLTLYASYAASAVERDRLLDQVTARNRVLETIQEMLETLAGPVSVRTGLTTALQSLRRGLRADEVALVTQPDSGPDNWRAYVSAHGTDVDLASRRLCDAAADALAGAPRDGVCRPLSGDGAASGLTVAFQAPGGPTALLAGWDARGVAEADRALMEDAAHSLNLALEREQAGVAHQEAVALRRSRELQRDFLSRLSHELRTPLTAIRGYASSLMAPDVTWDGDSKRRFLARISAESARLGRLVDDLLDFSAIESGVMRMAPDWCDLRLVAEAAIACLPQEWRAAVSIDCEPELPPVWADHDRLEQVLVNLLSNALRHNPPGARAVVTAAGLGERYVAITVSDDGAGLPAQVRDNPFSFTGRSRSATAGAGLGLSITKGIIEAHHGAIELVEAACGTAFCIRLPIEAPDGDEVPDERPDASGAAKLPALLASAGRSAGQMRDD